ncbi:MAG: glycosyltransferase [Flavobacteriales bacterium]|nr:glycosyltransferase [Flavobacteriales bacterium]
MTANDSLIIFVRNLDKGKVKTRLAESVGDDQALIIYHKLLQYTRSVTKQLNCDKFVYYSDRIDHNDLWDNMKYEKHLQQGQSLGERMQSALADQFALGKQRVLIIGSDCIELETYMIKEAFAVLENNDVVIGPASDGGYYLLGMRKFLPTLFENKEWSGDNLLMDTLLDLKKMSAKYYLLKTLNDIDTVEDLDSIGRRSEQKPEDWF